MASLQQINGKVKEAEALKSKLEEKNTEWEKELLHIIPKEPDTRDFFENYPDFKRESFVTFVLTGFGIVSYVLGDILSNAENWRRTYDETDAKNKAIMNRALFTSVFSQLTLGSLNAALDFFGGINGVSSAATMSILVGNLTGFVLDASLASEEGWGKVEYVEANGEQVPSPSPFAACFQHGFASIPTYNGLRYTLTVLFDLYISAVFTEGMKKIPFLVRLGGEGSPWESLLPTVFAMVVSTTTFFAYTNETRFRWAIRKHEEGDDDEADKKDDGGFIDNFTIFSLGSVAAVTYLSTEVDKGKGVHSDPMKAFNVLVFFIIMAAMVKFKKTDFTNPPPDDPNVWINGFAIYSATVIALVAYTFTTQSEKEKTAREKHGSLSFWARFGIVLLVSSTILIPFLLACTTGSHWASMATFAGLLAITVALLYNKDKLRKKTNARGSKTSRTGKEIFLGRKVAWGVNSLARLILMIVDKFKKREGIQEYSPELIEKTSSN